MIHGPKAWRLLLPALVALLVLALALPALAQDAPSGEQYDRTPRAGCYGYVGEDAGTTTAPYQYCHG